MRLVPKTCNYTNTCETLILIQLLRYIKKITKEQKVKELRVTALVIGA